MLNNSITMFSLIPKSNQRSYVPVIKKIFWMHKITVTLFLLSPINLNVNSSDDW
jgi:hypothetical protein